MPIMLEKQVDEILLKGKIRAAIDFNEGSLNDLIVTDMTKLSPYAMREMNSYLNSKFPIDMFPRTHTANMPYLMQLAELRMKAARIRIQPSAPGTYN